MDLDEDGDKGEDSQTGKVNVDTNNQVRDTSCIAFSPIDNNGLYYRMLRPKTKDKKTMSPNKPITLLYPATRRGLITIRSI